MIAAVLAVFLVAVLFMGAASAAPVGGTTVYVDQYNGNIGLAANTYYLYQNGQVAGSVTSDAATGAFLSSDAPVAGTYDASAAGLTAAAFVLKYPALTLDAFKTGTGSSIVGTSVLKTQKIDLSVSGTNGLNYGITFTTPAGGKTTEFGKSSVAPFGVLDFKDSTAGTGTFAAADLINIDISDVATGEWAAVAEFRHGGVAGEFVTTTPSKYLTSPKIKFTVGAPVSESISVNKEKITRGGSVLVTITGAPGAVVPVTIDALGFMPLAGQSGITTVAADYDATTGYLKSFRATLSSS